MMICVTLGSVLEKLTEPRYVMTGKPSLHCYRRSSPAHAKCIFFHSSLFIRFLHFVYCLKLFYMTPDVTLYMFNEPTI